MFESNPLSFLSINTRDHLDRLIVIFSFFFCSSIAFSSGNDQTSDSLKKRTFLTPIPSVVDIGLSANYYFYGLTPLEIYAYDVNQASSTTNSFDLINIAPGLTLRAMSDMGVGLEFSRNTVRVNADYSSLDQNGNVIAVTEKIKLSNTVLKFLFVKSLGNSPFYIGASMDLGRFKTLRKYEAEGISDKWQPFYTSASLFKDVSPGNLTAGVGLLAGYKFNRFKLQLSRQFLFLDAAMKGYTGSDAFFNTQNYQMSLTYGL